MRDLAVGGYTAAEVEASLRSADGVWTAEFMLLDRDLNPIGDLTANVEAATIEMDIERTVKASLTLGIVPHDLPAEAPDLDTAWFAYYVQPWWLQKMPDGGWARFPLGVFGWRPPDREINPPTPDGSRGDLWQVVLGDRCHDLDTAGPGPGGHKVGPDDKVTDAVKRVLRRAGISDTDGVVASDETANAWLTWTLVRNTRVVAARNAPYGVRVADEDTQPETWGGVANDLLDSIGHTSVWFDGDGAARSQPVSALRRDSLDVLYDTGADGVTLRPQRSEHDPARLANRMFCRAQRRNGDLLYGMADLDDVIPGHPLAFGSIRRHIDVVEDVPLSPSKTALEARARKKLLNRVSTFETFELETLAWPAHEAFDIVGVTVEGDPLLDGLHLFRERRWRLVLRGDGEGTMTHRLHRLVQVED